MHEKRMSGEQRRMQILEAAAKLIISQGIHRVSTRDVTGALGVGTGLLFHYFPTWNALQQEAIERALNMELEEMEHRMSDLAPQDALEGLVDLMVPDEDDNYWMLWLDVREAARRDPDMARILGFALNRWHSLISRLLSAKTRPANADLQAWELIGLVDGLAGYVLTDGVPPDANLMHQLLLNRIHSLQEPSR